MFSSIYRRRCCRCHRCFFANQMYDRKFLFPLQLLMAPYDRNSEHCVRHRPVFYHRKTSFVSLSRNKGIKRSSHHFNLKNSSIELSGNNDIAPSNPLCHSNVSRKPSSFQTTKQSSARIDSIIGLSNAPFGRHVSGGATFAPIGGQGRTRGRVSTAQWTGTRNVERA